MYMAITDGFLPELQRLEPQARGSGFFAADEASVRAALGRCSLTPSDFAVLLSPAAAGFLESMAGRAHRETTSHFGII